MPIDSSAVITMTEESGFESRQRQEIFVFCVTSRPALASTQSPIKWVSGVVSPGVKGKGREDDSNFHLMLRFSMVDLYLHSPTSSLHDA